MLERGGRYLKHDECPERIRLTDAYCRAITEFHLRKEVLARSPAQRNAEDWAAAEAASALSQTAWEAVQQHIAAHKCMPMAWP
jgi:hypothetical protein